jgi:hypothetical protein
MSKETDYPQVIRTGYVDDENGMFEVVEKSECESWHYYVEQLIVSITEPASGGDVGVVRFKEGTGDDWFEFNAHETGVYTFDLGSDGYKIAAKDSCGFQMICANAEEKQAKAWVLFRGHKRFN